MIYFTGDEHFGHENIIRFCNRPFSSELEMSEAIIHNHNSVIKPKDTVYMLGDCGYRIAPRKLSLILSRLNGKKKIIFGNHDKKILLKAERNGLLDDQLHAGTLQLLGDLYNLHTQYQGIKYHFVLCHYPILSWLGRRRGSIMIHGHCHATIADAINRFDAGVDASSFMPVSLPQAIERAKNNVRTRRDPLSDSMSREFTEGEA